MQVPPRHQNMVKEMVSSPKTYEDKDSEKDVPKHNYTFRIDASKIARVIGFLKNLSKSNKDSYEMSKLF